MPDRPGKVGRSWTVPEKAWTAAIFATLSTLGYLVLIVGTTNAALVAVVTSVMGLLVSPWGLPRRAVTTAKPETEPEVAARPEPRAVSLKDLTATPLPEGEYCRCGSGEAPVPVEVDFGLGREPDVHDVAWLCGECREQCSPAQARDRAAVALRRVAAENAALAARDQAAYVEERMNMLGLARAQAMYPLPAVPSGPAAPASPVEIEQDGWVYAFGWYADVDTFLACDHEWEEIRTHGSVLPVMVLCTRCEVRRRPAGECMACGGAGERFGYRCDPCRGSGRVVIT